MILILEPNTDPDSGAYHDLLDRLAELPDIRYRVHREHGAQQVLTEVYLIGNTARLSANEMAALPTVERVVRVSEEYRSWVVTGTTSAPAISTTTGYASVRTT